jgi:hypothetical protein
LNRTSLNESLLNNIQTRTFLPTLLRVVAQSFDRFNGVTLRLHRQHATGIYRFSVDKDRASTAFTFFAPAGFNPKIPISAKNFQEGIRWIAIDLDRFLVYL